MHATPPTEIVSLICEFNMYVNIVYPFSKTSSEGITKVHYMKIYKKKI